MSNMIERSGGRALAGRAAGLAVLSCALVLGPAPVLGADAVPEIELSVKRFAVRGDNPLSETDTATLLAPFLGERVGIDRLEAAAQALEQAMRDRGYAFHRVTVPPQTPAEGVIALSVVNFAVGTISVTGNRFFDEANIRASLPALKAGEAAHAPAVARQIAIANENPSKRAALTIRAGAKPDSVNAEIKVEDSNPQQIYFAFNNTGRRETGLYRATAAYQHNNLFGRDHSVTASFTTSPDHFEDVRQYGVNYAVPLYAQGGSVSAFYTRSDVNSGRIADFFDVKGRGEFVGLRYTQTFLKAGGYGHKLVVSLENHLFKNDVTSTLAAGQPLGTDVGSRPLALRYQGTWDVVGGSAGFHVEYARNLDGGGGNTQAAYTANQAGARHWDLWRFGLDASRVFARDWMLAARLRGQATTRELIPGEQFGLGGVYSIRGFRERETAGDSGYQLNLELWTPVLATSLRPLLFVDAGERILRDRPAAPGGRESLASMGAGLRWQWQRRLELSLDAARVIDGLVSGGSVRGSSRLHVGLIYRF